MTDQRLDALAEALDGTAALVAGVTPEQWTGPTPCADWDVRDLVTHLVQGHRIFTEALTGRPAPSGEPEVGDGDPVDPADRVDPVDPVPAYRSTADAMLAAFGAPGSLARPVTVGIGTVPGAVALQLRIVEALVHGWDLAQATGRPLDFRAELAEQALRFTEGALPSIPTGHRPFESPQPVAPDASALHRLVALLGRHPG